MPLKVDWFDPTQTIIRWEFSEIWTLEEYYAGADQTIEMTQNIPFYYVISFGPERLPPEIIKAAMSVHRRAGPQLRLTIGIVKSDYIKLIGRIIGQLPPARSKIYFADNETEALAFIERDRAMRAAQKPSPPNAKQT